MFVPRRALFAVLAVVAAVAVLPAVSASGAGRNSTRIVVSLKLPAFHGKLTSPRKGCLGSRKVKMYRQNGRRKKLLGRDTSSDNGRWATQVGKNIAPGSYYAKVAKRGKCKAAKSRVLRVG
jgi:hypothetical protein